VAAAFAVVVMGARAPGGGGGRSQAGLDEVLEDGHEEEHGDEDRRGREPEGDGAGVGGGGGGVGAPRGRCRVVPGDDVGGRLGRRARARHSHPRPRPGHAACDGARLLATDQRAPPVLARHTMQEMHASVQRGSFST
jgi:hypothetical protein